MYLLIEKNSVYEPFCNVTLYRTKEEAVKELQDIVADFRNEFNLSVEHMDEDTENYYCCLESSCRYIDVYIEKVEFNKTKELK